MAKKFIVETSARHIHVTAETFATLFGADAVLHNKKDLSQPGQFACEERVTLVGPKKSIANVIILGPARPATQVEVSFTDARTLGVAAPVRESGDVKGSAVISQVPRVVRLWDRAVRLRFPRALSLQSVTSTSHPMRLLLQVLLIRRSYLLRSSPLTVLQYSATLLFVLTPTSLLLCTSTPTSPTLLVPLPVPWAFWLTKKQN